MGSLIYMVYFFIIRDCVVAMFFIAIFLFILKLYGGTMKKIKVLGGVVFAVVLCICVLISFGEDEKKQITIQSNGNQDENSILNKNSEDGMEVSKPEEGIEYIGDDKNALKNSTDESIKSDVIIDINTSEETTKNHIIQGEEVSNRDDFVDWDELIDSDDDGLPDTYENDIGTDIYKSDTDDDGLPDGYESLYSITNPLNKYSLDNGIIDAELDLDYDGLGTLEEYEYGTDPLEADTDFDGVYDSCEVKIYGTSPLLYDTDEDTLSDGIEIEMGLSPLNASTYGYNDKEHSCKVNIENDSEILYKINQNNDEYQLNLIIEGNGQAFSDIFVRESAYTDIIDSEYVLGIIPEIMCYEENGISSIVLEFEISDKNINEEQEVSAFAGVNKYNIFKYDEEEKLLYPIDTYTGEKDNVIGTVANELGTYCIIDMEKWLGDLGFDVVENDMGNYTFEETAVQEHSLERVDELSEKSSDNNLQVFNVAEDEMTITQEEEWAGGEIIPFTILESQVLPEENIDVVFVFNNYIEKLSKQEFTLIKENIVIISEYLFNGSESARVYIIDQYGELVCASAKQDYASDIYQVKEMVNKLSNIKYVSANLYTQVNTLINSTSLRNDAKIVSVFIGNTYCSSPEVVYENIVKNKIQSVFVSPQTQEGSFCDILASETDGILLYNYIDFSKDLIKHIYGYLPTIHYIPYTIVSSTGLSVVTLKNEIKKDGKTKSDTDKLSDWDEIAQDKVTIKDDGSVILPNYWDYLYTYFQKKLLSSGWIARYSHLRNKDGKTLEEMLSEIYVLPINSDPTKEDSDGDGIKDDEEVSWNGIDERYKDLSPLHKDTVETLFPEITESGYNNRAYSTYITVADNDVTLHVKAYFTGDAEMRAIEVLKSEDLSFGYQRETDAILDRLGEDCTMKDLIIDGIKERWEGSYEGNEFDFHNGLFVNFSIDFVEDFNPEVGERSIEIKLNNGVCGISNHWTWDWKTNSSKIVEIYTSYCDLSLHKGEDGLNCEKYLSKKYNIATYAGTIAHEFGHVFGLKDMYASASDNYGYEPISNDELLYNKDAFGLPESNGIMMYNGRAVTNDIEMIMLAFCENEVQYYVPYSIWNKMSKAIKCTTLFREENNPDKTYFWNDILYTFQII